VLAGEQRLQFQPSVRSLDLFEFLSKLGGVRTVVFLYQLSELFQVGDPRTKLYCRFD